MFNTKVSIEKKSKFSILPSELLKVFDQIDNYFRWFHICRSPYTLDVMEYLLAKALDLKMWFDGVLNLVQVRDKALDEVCGNLDQFLFVR